MPGLTAKYSRLLALGRGIIGLMLLTTLIGYSIVPFRSDAVSSIPPTSGNVSLTPTTTVLGGYSQAYYGLHDHTSGQCNYNKVHDCNVNCGPDTIQLSDQGGCTQYVLRTQYWLSASYVVVCIPTLVQINHPLSVGECGDHNANTTEQMCTGGGYYWNYTTNTCQDTPSTQLQCDTADWYWNFTNSTCGSSPSIGMCGGGADWSHYVSTGCYSSLSLFSGSCGRSTTFINKCYQDNGDYDTHYCVCIGCDWCGGSPILIDVGGGLEMTDVNHGVKFDLNANGTLDRLSWTAPNSGAAWLVLDRNLNGVINNGKEMFGNFTFQPEPPSGVERNGFRALAEYDKPENGGNADGNIDQSDAVFSVLRLWQDANQNGVSESAEMHSLSEFGIESISLDYRESRHRDRYGNEFRYRAKIYGQSHQELGRWAYDVFLLSN